MESKDKTYWIEQAKERILYNDSVENTATKQLMSLYDEAAYKLEREINALFGKFSADNKLTSVQAAKLLSDKEHSVWRKTIKGYIDSIKGKGGDSKTLLELNTLAMKSRISRHEELLGNIYKNMLDLAKDSNLKLDSVLSDVYKTNYYRGHFNLQKGLKVAFNVSKINEKLVKNVLEYPWSTKNYSKNLWDDIDKLTALTKREIAMGFISGSSVQKMTKSIDDVMGKGRYAAERLVRTECKYFASQGELQSYKANGITQYRFMSNGHDGHACNCDALNGGIFYVDKGEAGVNLPPIHPNCKCYIISVPQLSVFSNRNVTPLSENVKFEEWKKKYVTDNKFGDVNLEPMAINDKAISAVKPVKSNILSKHQQKQLAKKHKDLLTYVQDDPVGTEAIAYYDMNFKELARYKGKIGHVDGRAVKGKHIAIHNHPSGNTFTHTDIRSFILNPDMAMLTAVGNDGKVFALEKSIHFNDIDAAKSLAPIIEKFDKGEYNVDEYILDITKWLKGVERYGANFIG